MLMHHDATARQAIAPSRFLQLPGLVTKRNRVIARHHALGLHAEDPVQIRTARLAKGCSSLLGGYCKPGVKLRDVTLPQKLVGLLDGLEASQAQLLRQPSLPSAKVSFAPSSRLR